MINNTIIYTGWVIRNNTETNQNYTDTNDIFGTNSIPCKDIKKIIIKANYC